MNLFQRSNNALSVNPPYGDTYALTTHGSDWLWAVTAVYLLALLAFIALTFIRIGGEKVFHHLFTISLFVGTIAYFAMASDLGSTPIFTADNAAGTREIFYARYINWIIGWVPLVIAIGLLSGVSWTTIIFNIALLWTWIGSWLAGAVTATNYKWGFFAFGLLAFFLLAASLLHTGRLGAGVVGARHYLPITGFLVFLWLLYSIAYGVDDGGNKITVTHGFVFFGILDLLTVPLLSFAFLFLARSWDYDALGLGFTQRGRGGRRLVNEKGTAGTTTGGIV